MKTWVHSIFSLILAIIFYPEFGWETLSILIGGVLIDVDHYLWYIFKFKNFDLFRCYTYFIFDIRKMHWKDILGSILIFHTIEFLALSVFLSFYSDFALLFTIGLIGHYILDMIWHFFVPRMVLVNHSVIYWFLKNNIQKV